MGLGGSSVTSIPQAPPSPALVIDIFLVRWTDGHVDKLLSKEQPALRRPTPLVFPSERWGLSASQGCCAPRPGLCGWPGLEPLCSGDAGPSRPPPRLSVAVSTWTTAESARDGPLPGRQACLCPRPLSQGLSGTTAPDLRAFIPDPCTAHVRRHEGLTRQLEPRLGAPECGRRPGLSAWPSWIPRGSPCSRGQREGPREKTEVHRGAARRRRLRGWRREGRGGWCVSVGSRGRGEHRSGSVTCGRR